MRISTSGCIVVALACAASSQPLERNWRIGGDSVNSWTDRSGLNILADDQSAPGSLQPLELRPDENILPYIYSLYPFERRTVTARPLWADGMPRMWRGFGSLGPRGADMNAVPLYVDGDDGTFAFVVNYLGHKARAEFYTFDMGGALPFERFIVRMPPAGQTDKFGEPWENYVPRNGELSGSWQGEQIPDEIKYGESYRVTNEFGELLKEDYRP